MIFDKHSQDNLEYAETRIRILTKKMAKDEDNLNDEEKKELDKTIDEVAEIKAKIAKVEVIENFYKGLFSITLTIDIKTDEERLKYDWQRSRIKHNFSITSVTNNYFSLEDLYTMAVLMRFKYES